MYDLLIVTLNEIEACGKRVGRSNVEVIFGNLIEGLGDILQTQLEVLLNIRVGLNQVTTIVLGIQLSLGLGRIRDAGILSTQALTTPRHTEDLGQDKVVISTDHVGLALDGVKTLPVGSSHLLSTNHTGLFKLGSLLQDSVSTGDGTVATIPHTRGGVTVGNVKVHILPSINLLVGLAVETKVIANTLITGRVVIDDVVARELAHQGIVGIHVTRNEQLLQLVQVHQINACVRHFVKEVLARAQAY